MINNTFLKNSITIPKNSIFTVLMLLVFVTSFASITYSQTTLAESQSEIDRSSIYNGTARYKEGDGLVICSSQGTAGFNSTDVAVQTAIFKTDSSKDNDARIWQFLTGTEGLGLSTAAAAGLMGNMSVETGGSFDPSIIEGGSGEGLGILQWSFGRRDKLEAYTAAAKATDPSADLLDIQLSYLRKELTITYKDTYAMLKTATNVSVKENGNTTAYSDPVEVSTIVAHGSSGRGKFTVLGIRNNFIASGDDFSNVVPGNRYIAALKYYKNYTGSDGPAAEQSPTQACINQAGLSTQAGAYGWDLEGPNKMTYYIQEGQSWSDYPFPGCSSPSTIGSCGCPVVTVASIISTLTPYKQNPQEIMEEWGRGFYSDYPTKEKYGLLKNNIRVSGGSANWSEAVNTLRSGGLIMAHANRGTFTSNVHWFVIRKVSEDGNSFYVYDLRNPKSETNNKAFSKEELLNEGAIDILYGFTKK